VSQIGRPIGQRRIQGGRAVARPPLCVGHPQDFTAGANSNYRTHGLILIGYEHYTLHCHVAQAQIAQELDGLVTEQIEFTSETTYVGPGGINPSTNTSNSHIAAAALPVVLWRCRQRVLGPRKRLPLLPLKSGTGRWLNNCRWSPLPDHRPDFSRYIRTTTWSILLTLMANGLVSVVLSADMIDRSKLA
jgi:hypothetical protein